MVSKLAQDDFAGAQYIIGTVGKDKAHFMGLADPFRTSWLLRGGMENLLMDSGLDPKAVESPAFHESAWAEGDLAPVVVELTFLVG